MKSTIESFKVNHLVLRPGLYVSRVDRFDKTVITTYDIRMTHPYFEPAMQPAAMHTLEHLGATFLRNDADEIKQDVIYFGPMGCQTGFYLVMYGEPDIDKIKDNLKDMFYIIKNYLGDIPGATTEQCGNYSLQDLNMARYHAKMYYDVLTSEDCPHEYVYL